MLGLNINKIFKNNKVSKNKVIYDFFNNSQVLNLMKFPFVNNFDLLDKEINDLKKINSDTKSTKNIYQKQANKQKYLVTSSKNINIENITEKLTEIKFSKNKIIEEKKFSPENAEQIETNKTDNPTKSKTPEKKQDFSNDNFIKNPNLKNNQKSQQSFNSERNFQPNDREYPRKSRSYDENSNNSNKLYKNSDLK